MPVAITIRNVPDGVRNELAARAATKGWSLQEYLLSELRDLATRPDRTTLLAQIRADLGSRPALSLDDLLEARDADRR